MTTPTRRRVAGIVAAAALVIALGACSSDDAPAATPETGDVSGDIGANGGSEEPGGAVEEALPGFVSESDFASVCRGIGLSSATAFPTVAPHRVVVLEGEDPDYSPRSVGLPDDWVTEIGDTAAAELVVCLNRVAATPAELCEGYEDSSSGLSWSVQTHSATYEVTLRAATTGDVLDSTTIDAAAGSCPMFSTFREGDPQPKPEYPRPTAELEVFLAPTVQGA